MLVLAVAAGACSSSVASSASGTREGEVAATVATTVVTTVEITVSDRPTTTTSPPVQIAVFDPEVVHTISVEYAAADYDAMIAAYRDGGAKNWIEATVTIDEQVFRRAGTRLKGNSSLFGVGGNNQVVVAADPNLPSGSAPTAISVIGQPPPGQPPPGFGPIGAGNAETPEKLPWLIRLDKFVKDQEYQGQREFVVRSNSSETSLNEVLAVELLAKAGLATNRMIEVKFSVNGGKPRLRLVVENLGETWAVDTFGEGGLLYKAEASGDYTYRGTDPGAYDQMFKQEAGEANLTPLIEFLDFINNSSDADFTAKLGDRLDLPAFAKYLALEDLVGNFDDISGPGNNSYLYFDPVTKKFTVVAWDHNLAFGVGFGPGGPGGPPGFDPTKMPAGFDPAKIPGFLKPNPLVDRFNKIPEFAAMVSEAKTSLQKELFDSGVASELLKKWQDVVIAHADSVVSAATVSSEAAAVTLAFPKPA